MCENFANVARNAIYRDAIKHFSNGADFFLVALAHQESYTIVTHEVKSSGNTQNRIKIPDVCEKLEICCIDVAEFLRCERAKFVLEQS